VYRYNEAQRRRDKMIAVMEADLLKRKNDANARMSKVGLYSLNALDPQLESALISTLEPIK
jgi:hypothetical protein